MNSYERDYKALLNTVLCMGAHKEGRNGKTLSKFGVTLRVDLQEGFPLLTARKMHYKGVFGELAAFVRGHQMLADYKNLGCNYWDANAVAWAENEGLGLKNMSIGQYVGSLWRDFSAHSETQSEARVGRDQLRVLTDQLRNNPSSRRHVLSSWHPGAKSCIPPCVVMTVFNVEDDELNCHVTMRSCDMCLGLPSDVAGMALLVYLLCRECGLRPGVLMFTLVDAHIYAEHAESLESYLQEPVARLPKLVLHNVDLFTFKPEEAELVGYLHGPTIQFPFVV